MPRYFFHVRDGRGIEDDEGIELPNLAAAMRAAVHYAGSLLKEAKTEILPDKTWALEVNDAAGRSIFHIDLRLHAPVPSSMTGRIRSVA